jgi:hypothetical protein
MPSYPLTYPTNTRLTPKSIQFTAKTQNAQFLSPFTGQSQTVRFGGQWWELTLNYAPLFQTDAEELTGFLNALAGTAGSFNFKLPSKFLMSTSTTVNVSTSGNDFTSPSQTIQVGKFGATASGRLVQFTTSTSLFPKIPSGNSVVISPSNNSKFRLATNELNFSVDEMMITGVTIPIVEAF